MHARRKLPQLPPPPLTAEELGALYDELNRALFGGVLQKDTVSWNEPGFGFNASTHPWLRSIYISPRMGVVKSLGQIREILLHEMCHVATRGPDGRMLEHGHGPIWQAAMMRLHEQGEAWVLKDIENSLQADAERKLVEAMMREMCNYDLTLPWGKVRNRLVKKVGREGRETLRWSPEPQDFWLSIRRRGTGGS